MGNFEPDILTYQRWYTSAPEAYDGFGTVTLIAADKTGKHDARGRELRCVGIVPEHAEWQRDRYGSGLHGSYTDTELKQYFT